MSKKIVLISGEAKINEAIAKLQKAGTKFQNDTHVLACSVLKHVGEFGDVRVVERFLKAMPTMARANTLRVWFEDFGPIAFDKKGALHVAGKATNLEGAMADPFFKHSPAEVPYVSMTAEDAAKALESLTKRFVKDAQLTKRNHDAIITALKSIPVDSMAAC